MSGKSFMTKAFLSIMVLWAGSQSQEIAQDAAKTLSPYFLVNSDDPAVDRLPLLSTSAHVNIAGVIADVKVTQAYKNEGNKAIEAIYVFPASTRAAVYAMRMTIAGRVIQAVIKERKQARADYEAAKQQGKGASLLEQQRPNVFQMNVANIMPGDTVKVEMNYTELLVPVDNVYEFAYPTVVGPRYSNKPEAGAKESDTWTQNPYLHAGQKPTYAFSIGADIKTGVPIQDIACPSHKVNISYDGPASASMTLDKSESCGGNRDFILKYRLAGNAIESGLLLYKGEKENFFLLMVQPPKRVAVADIPRREYIFVVDVSGSMNGYPLDISKGLLKNLISGLRPVDCFNVVLFAGGASVMSETSLPATAENIKRAIDVIDHQQGGGGTELVPALKRAMNLPRAEGTSRSVIIATDGFVDVEPEAFELIRNNLNNANVFAFGIGTSVNRHLIEGMAHAGNGEPFVVTAQNSAVATAEKFREYVKSPVLTNIKCSYDGFSTYDVEPLSIPDVFAARPVIIFGKWKNRPDGSITLTGTTGRDEYRQRIDVGRVKASEGNAALRYLWARSRIATLGDFNALRGDESAVKEITALGLQYNLLTNYTSFVAIDSEIRNKDGKSHTVKQPLPLPEGVSDLAVGGQAQGGGMLNQSMRMGYGGGAGAPMAAPRCAAKFSGANAMEIDALQEGTQTKAEYEKQALGDKKKTTVPDIDPASLSLHGQTIMYFWTGSCTKCHDDIDAIIRFALAHPAVNVVIVTIAPEAAGDNMRLFNSRLAHVRVPQNVSIVSDPKAVTCARFGVPTSPHVLPVALFMKENSAIKSVYGPWNGWNDAAKVLANFNK
jgi:Ca-activated chloride channel family protein